MPGSRSACGECFGAGPPYRSRRRLHDKGGAEGALAEEGRSAKVNDLWIAAVAAANGMDVVSQDDDFDAIEAVGGPSVIRV